MAVSQQRTYKLPQGVSKQGYSQEYVVVKLKKNAVESSKKGRTGGILSQYETQHFLSYLDKPGKSTQAKVAQHPLNNIYLIKLTGSQQPLSVIDELLQNDEVIYAEPYFNYRPLFIPNDPAAQPGKEQWYLTNINAYNAWTIEKGDTSIVVGILDTGILPDHYDLKDNIAINYDDPINGVDDDNDGLVDNYKGWDIANNDNNPLADTDLHGHEVAGVLSASTNNGAGTAGIGFRSRFMPIKIFTSGFNFFYKGYEAIALAAELGCQVINLSWGSAGSYSQAGEDVINYVVNDLDVVVVGAAGNTNAELDFYPASYNNVLSVSATDVSDEKANFATYSYKVDLVAPGKSIYVSNGDSTFGFNQGTSFASPMAAGTAALIRARFPTLTARQVMERIRVNTDDIYNLAGNTAFQGKLGKGRLNMYKALTDNISPSLRITYTDYTNGVGRHAYYGDTLSISVALTNYLRKTNHATATLSTASPYVEILQDEFDLGELPTLSSKNNENNPFRVKLANNLPPGEKLVFRLDFSDGTYQDFEYFTITSSNEYLNIDNDKIALTVNSKGELGYNQDTYSQGIGLTFNGQKVLDNMGLIIADQPNRVKDNAPSILSINVRNHDFDALNSIKFYQNSIAPLDVRSSFRDKPNLPNPLNVMVDQKILAWKANGEDDYMIMEYRLTNTGSSNLSEVHAGLFADWNLNDKNFNQADWDNTNLIGYTKDVNTDTLYTGIALLSSTTPFYFAINNKNANGNTADIQNTITDENKFDLVASGTSNTTAGQYGGGNDVSQAIGYTITNIGVNNSQTVAFAIVAGNSLTDLQNAATKAANQYQNYLDTPPLLHIAQTCPGDVVTIDPPQGTTYAFYDDLNLTNLLYTGDQYTTPPVNSTQTYYVINKDATYDGEVYRVLAQPKFVNTDFSMSSNPLLLDETGNTEIRFTDQSVDAQSWSWDFDNGYVSSVQNPMMNYLQPGSYDIKLTATNDLGCVEMTTRTLEVANRSNKPDITNQNICKGETITVSATNATALKVYADANLNTVVHSGTSFTSGQIFKDTTFYITSVDSVYESNPKAVKVITSKLKADFAYQIDTTDLSQKHLLHFINKSANETLYAWIINDQLEGNSTDITYNYDGLNSIDVKLLAEDINGCQDSLITTLLPKESPLPTANAPAICSGDDITLAPGNGHTFMFYGDAALSNTIQKGSEIHLDSLVADTTIYITAIDSLLESDPVEVTIDVNDITASFNLSPDSLDIADLNQLAIANNSTSADAFSWFVNDSLWSEAADPVLNFEDVGQYDITLLASNTLGCIDSQHQVLIISNITGRNFLSTGTLSIYPNPTTGPFTIQNNQPMSIKVLSANGHTLFYQKDIKTAAFDLSQYPNGVYLIEIKDSHKVVYKKIIKQD